MTRVTETSRDSEQQDVSTYIVVVLLMFYNFARVEFSTGVCVNIKILANARESVVDTFRTHK
jgi:hypothetical protein